MKPHIWWIIGGIIAVLGGVFALLNPFPATLAVNFLAGWAFLLLGIFACIGAFQLDTAWHKLVMFLFGLSAAFLGYALLADPFAGILTLTVLVGVLVFVSGLTRLVAAFRLNRSDWFWMMLLSGVISILLAVLIFAEFPSSGLSILGIFLGIELIFSGMGMFSMATVSKRVEDAIEG